MNIYIIKRKICLINSSFWCISNELHVISVKSLLLFPPSILKEVLPPSPPPPPWFILEMVFFILTSS